MSVVYVQETTFDPNGFQILTEGSKIKDNGRLKFKAVLQTLGERNNNGRIYPPEAIKDALEKNKERINKRQFIGELDHPDNGNDIARQGTPKLKEASHVITKVWIEGNKVYGEGETLSTPNGQILRNLILDNVIPGFSLRAFGNLETKRINGESVDVVSAPLLMISYDAVSNPSHSEALVKEYSQLDENTIYQCAGNLCEASLAQQFLIELELQNILKEEGFFHLEEERWWDL
jgi:hypothetical protein